MNTNTVVAMSPAEEFLTVAAYICYILSLLGYAGHLLAHAARQRLSVAVAGEVSQPLLADAETVEIRTPRRRGAVPAATAWPEAGQVGLGVLVLAWVLLTGALVLRWQSADHPPYVSLYDITMTMVWGSTLIFLLLMELWMKAPRTTGAFFVIIIALLNTYGVVLVPPALKTASPLVPALRSELLMIHVSIAILAYSAFTIAAGAALLYLVKHYQVGSWTRVLPTLPAIDEYIFRAVAIGFPLQSLLLITGAYWAHFAWAKAWSWDPKEIWALITWLFYAAFLHVRVQRGWRGSTMAWLALVGFAVVMITFVGVNWLVTMFGLQSLHTYSGNDLPGMALFLLFLGLLIALVGGILWRDVRRRRRISARQVAGARVAQAGAEDAETG